MKAALVIAHPDDESLWFGGIVLDFNKVAWTIVCCSIPRIDPIRAWKFHDACVMLRARGKVLPVVESPPNEPLKNLDWLDLNGYDLIVTHGKDGETGHLHHKQVHEHIVARWSSKLLLTGGGPITLSLTEPQLARKKEALTRYDHKLPHNGIFMPKWEALIDRYCTRGGHDLGTETYTLHGRLSAFRKDGEEAASRSAA